MAYDLNHTLFPVKECPVIYDIAGDNEVSNLKGETGYKLIVREDNHEILGCVTDEYKLVRNQDIIDSATPILESNGATLKEAVVLGQGAKTIWKWLIPDVKVKIMENDYVNPEIIIKNSYDASLQVHVLSGAFRLVCSNGLVIGIVISKHNHKHSVNNLSLDHLDNAIEQTVLTTKKIVKDDFPLLCDTKIQENHIIKAIELFPSTMSEFIVQYLVANKPTTYWDLLNVCTYIATHRMNRTYNTTHQLETNVYPKVSKWAKSVAQA